MFRWQHPYYCNAVFIFRLSKTSEKTHFAVEKVVSHLEQSLNLFQSASAIAEHLLLLANIAPQFCSVRLDGEKIEHVQNGAIIIVSPEASVNYVKNEVANELKKMGIAD